MLQCHVKQCTSDNYPLRIEDVDLQIVEADFNYAFIEKMLTRLDWNVLVQTSLAVRLDQLISSLALHHFHQNCQKIHRKIF